MTERKHLTQKQKAEVLLRQNGRCAGSDCGGAKLIKGMFEFDHIQDLQFEGDNEIDNWQALCKRPCHQNKTTKAKQSASKADRIFVGGRERLSRPMDGTRRSGLRKRMNGNVERW